MPFRGVGWSAHVGGRGKWPTWACFFVCGWASTAWFLLVWSIGFPLAHVPFTERSDFYYSNRMGRRNSRYSSRVRSEKALPPRDYVVAQQAWPHGGLANDTPTGVRALQVIAQRLRDHMDQEALSARTVSTRSGVGTQVITRLLNGQSVPDVGTVARLEVALSIRLWPDDLTYAAH